MTGRFNCCLNNWLSVWPNINTCMKILWYLQCGWPKGLPPCGSLGRPLAAPRKPHRTPLHLRGFDLKVETRKPETQNTEQKPNTQTQRQTHHHRSLQTPTHPLRLHTTHKHTEKEKQKKQSQQKLQSRPTTYCKRYTFRRCVQFRTHITTLRRMTQQYMIFQHILVATTFVVE